MNVCVYAFMRVQLCVCVFLPPCAQARPPAEMFVGYGGNQVRASVKEGCDWWVTDFKDLIDELAK